MYSTQKNASIEYWINWKLWATILIFVVKERCFHQNRHAVWHVTHQCYKSTWLPKTLNITNFKFKCHISMKLASISTQQRKLFQSTPSCSWVEITCRAALVHAKSLKICKNENQEKYKKTSYLRSWAPVYFVNYENMPPLYFDNRYRKSLLRILGTTLQYHASNKLLLVSADTW